jgi:hypothetical protein
MDFIASLLGFWIDGYLPLACRLLAWQWSISKPEACLLIVIALINSNVEQIVH